MTDRHRHVLIFMMFATLTWVSLSVVQSLYYKMDVRGCLTSIDLDAC